jgi:1-acyl-sn-glycerol-3-phosphate acyltransferase
MPDARPANAKRKSIALSLHNIYETLVISWPTVVDAFAGRVTMSECNRRLTWWAAEIAKNSRYELEIVGRENLGTHHESFLVMSNHQSLYDIPVLFHVLGANLRMITKAELFRVPVFGDALKHAGFISIDRSNRERAMKSLEIARQGVADGLNVWIAPEGTRSKTGELLPFKKGGFNLALEAGLRVLPVTFGLGMRILRRERVSRNGNIGGGLAIVGLVVSMAVVTRLSIFLSRETMIGR